MTRFALRSPWRILLSLILLGGMGIATGYLYLKRSASRNSVALDVDWNPAHTCSITTYATSLGGPSVMARIFLFVSSPTFFRVHDREGRLLKSSEWLLWQREAGDMESPRWANDRRVLYPTTEGYADWVLPDCGLP